MTFKFSMKIVATIIMIGIMVELGRRVMWLVNLPSDLAMFGGILLFACGCMAFLYPFMKLWSPE